MDLWFHVAGEASQSWWEVRRSKEEKVMSYMDGSRQKEIVQGNSHF